MKKSAGRKQRRNLATANRKANGRAKMHAHSWAKCSKAERLSRR